MISSRSILDHWKSQHRCLRGEPGAQLVEFAVALPLLVLFVVGIFDFSNAYTLKQRLTNIARDAALASAYDPGSDVPSPSVGTLPVSVNDAFQLVNNYLIASNLNNCGITSTGTASGLTWTFTANGNGCPTAGLTIVVNRGYYLAPNSTYSPPATCAPSAPGAQVAVISTCVSIQYPYTWKFGNVASLLGRSMTLPVQISAVSVAMNEN
jgi:Flp pilus assembly protein TadG